MLHDGLIGQNGGWLFVQLLADLWKFAHGLLVIVYSRKAYVGIVEFWIVVVAVGLTRLQSVQF